MLNQKAVELLKQHEGFRKDVYLCTAEKKTIGYGYNIEANPLKLPPSTIQTFIKGGIDHDTAEELLSLMVERIEHNLVANLPWFSKLNSCRQAVLIDMAYNLGIDGLLKFKVFLMHLERRDYNKAAVAMLASKWAVQVKSRASNLSNIVIGGVC